METCPCRDVFPRDLRSPVGNRPADSHRPRWVDPHALLYYGIRICRPDTVSTMISLLSENVVHISSVSSAYLAGVARG